MDAVQVVAAVDAGDVCDCQTKPLADVIGTSDYARGGGLESRRLVHASDGLVSSLHDNVVAEG